MQPIFLKVCTVPFKLLPLVEEELQSLVQARILEKINTSKATPIVRLSETIRFVFVAILALQLILIC